ncbi:MAG TPA: type II toxin-antitoxin system prevent-host-death family antitoxin [Verrucomicrobiae bacterium]|nr:type II toxin-antitoxin system prevent-host-death family antitoxin [Verrucomicrobiae bacterium]
MKIKYHHYIRMKMGAKSISAAEANRNFSRVLDGVRQGRSFVVTSHGKPVATIEPAETTSRAEIAARRSLLERLSKQPALNNGRWTRDELYEDPA